MFVYIVGMAESFEPTDTGKRIFDGPVMTQWIINNPELGAEYEFIAINRVANLRNEPIDSKPAVTVAMCTYNIPHPEWNSFVEIPDSTLWKVPDVGPNATGVRFSIGEVVEWHLGASNERYSMSYDSLNPLPSDTTPPEFTASVDKGVLWPPNHKMVPVKVLVSAYDGESGVASTKITSVTSNEPVDGLGDGDTVPDWVITGDLTVNLRAERSGTGNGRVYTITVVCTDHAGNSSVKNVAVYVPRDQKK